MSDQPRWPAGTPVAPSGRGPGGGRFRGDWAEQTSARMLPSLRGMMEHYGTIPRLDKIRRTSDPPWGASRTDVAEDPTHLAEKAWAALGFDFEDLESRKVAFDGLMAVTVADLQRYGFSRAAAVRGVARARLLAAQVIAGTMSAHRLSQVGRREGQGRDDMWLGKALILYAGWGGGVYDLRRSGGRL